MAAVRLRVGLVFSLHTCAGALQPRPQLIEQMRLLTVYVTVLQVQDYGAYPRHLKIILFFLVFLSFLGPLPAVYGGSQARGPIGGVQP